MLLDLHPNSSFSELLLPLSRWAVLWYISGTGLLAIRYPGPWAVAGLFALFHDWFAVLLLM